MRYKYHDWSLHIVPEILALTTDIRDDIARSATYTFNYPSQRLTNTDGN